MRVSSFSEIETEFIERVHRMVWCAAASIDTKDRVRSRVLHPFWEGATGWIATRRHSLKEKHIQRSPFLSLAYIADVTKPVYVDCTASWQDDSDSKDRVWHLFSSSPPPLGYDLSTIFKTVENEEFGLLRLTPWRIELFDISTPPDFRRVWQP